MEEKEKVSDKVHRKYSLILDNFSQDVMTELTKVTMMSCHNNQKCAYIKEILTNAGIKFSGLGSGTNRYAINMAANLNNVAVKIALDDDGKIDNRREFLYGKDLYPDVCKVYECLPDGLIAVFEYVVPFDLHDLNTYEDQMREILERVSKLYMIGDVGISPNNYKNWGKRTIDEKVIPCMLDYAYIYSVTYKLFICECDGITSLQYDDNFVDLVCPTCGRKRKFAQIRRRVTRQKQEEEIGDIRRLGYVLHNPVEMVEDQLKFMPKPETSEDEKESRKKKKRELAYEKLKQVGKIERSSEEEEEEKLMDMISDEVMSEEFPSFVAINSEEVNDEQED